MKPSKKEGVAMKWFVVLGLLFSAQFAHAERCMFNPSTERYQQCHHVTADGKCAHYGMTCTGTGGSMYNPATNQNQQCHHVTADGKCAHYGAATSGPSGQCMFNKTSGAYQTCHHVTANGQCAHFGAACK
jgi:hypothetical protein